MKFKVVIQIVFCAMLALPGFCEYYVAEIDGQRWSIGYDRYTHEATILETTATGNVSIPAYITVSIRNYKDEIEEEFSCRVVSVDFWCVHDGITSVTIPSTVMTISDYAFQDWHNLRSVTIPSSVVSIGFSAFRNCESLESVTLPGGVSVAQYAFAGCSSLASVIISDGVGRIEGCTFAGCDKLSTLTIPSTVKCIDFGAFTDCVSLSSVFIAEGVEEINSDAFTGCTSLSAVVIPSTVAEMNCAFRNCNALTSVVINANCEMIPSDNFEGCHVLRSVEFLGKIHRIGTCDGSGFRFGDLPSLEVVFLGGGVEEIGSAAFENARNLKSVMIEKGVRRISSDAFSGCFSLTAIFIPESVEEIGAAAFANCVNLTSVELPCGVTRVESSLCRGCRRLASVSIPDGVSDIGDSAFGECESLVSVFLPGSVKNIGQGAFAKCSGLKFVSLQEGVTNIEDGAFLSCRSISTMTIPSSVNRIGEQCFERCINLNEVRFLGNSPEYVGGLIFAETSLDLNVVVPVGSTGWNGEQSNSALPKRWPYYTETGRFIRHLGDPPKTFDNETGGGGGVSSSDKVNLTVTNVVVNYILNSVKPEIAFPVTLDTGFVNVISEIRGGNVAIPDSWASNFPMFATSYGTDFSKALTKQTGKRDAAGNPLQVWHDFVAGTDPTDKMSIFVASVTMVDGKPVVSYSPELNDTEKAKRIYTIWGKVRLQDKDWSVVSPGNEVDYNFFKVTVEMK